MVKFTQIAVAPVFGASASSGLQEHQTNELYALDERGRVWRQPTAWGGTSAEWELMPSPDEPSDPTQGEG